MNLRELQDQRGRLVTQARDALNEINGNTDDSRAAELEARHDTIMREMDALDARIAREQRVADAEQRQLELTEAEQRNQRNRRPLLDGEGRGDNPGEEITYRDAFHEYVRCAGQIGEMSPEARNMLRSHYSAVQGGEQRAQTTSNTAGGYTVPVELSNILIKSMLAFGPMYNEDVCTVIATNSGNRITMPTVNDTAVTAEITPGEGVTYTDDGGKDVTFGQKVLDAYVYQTEWLRISRELADDSIFAMESLIGELLGERLGRVANLQLTVGDGTGDPNGIVTASTAAFTAAGAAALTGDELINLVHAVDPAYRTSPKTGFMFNDATLAVMRKLKDGDNNYLWQMGNIQQGVPGSLLGYRYHVNQAMAGVATGNRSVLFGDFGKYFVRKVGQPLVLALQDKDFAPGFGMMGWVRLDGELGDTAAVKHIVQA